MPAGKKAQQAAIEDADRRAQQRTRQDHYRRLWQRQVEALATPDDDRYKFVRGASMASELGTGRSTVYHTINPGLARHLDQARMGYRFETAPARPSNVRVAQYLGPATRDPYQLAAARLHLAATMPDHSLVLELTGWQLISENDLARAFDEGPRSGWSQQRINERKIEACGLVRGHVAQMNVPPDQAEAQGA